MLCIKDEKDNPCTHILLRGYAGCGKSTLVNKLAHDWSQLHERSNTISVLNHFGLVLALDGRKFEKGNDLETTIQQQILPNLSSEEIRKVILFLKNRCLFLVDGYDEISLECLNDRIRVLESPLLVRCWVIVTTRPHMVDNFSQRFDGYVHIEVSGFSKNSINEYVQKFFEVTPQAREPLDLERSLLRRIRTVPIYKRLSKYPILLLMICHLWLDQQNERHIPENITKLYVKAIEYLNSHWEKRCMKDTGEVILELGKISIDSLFEGKLYFLPEKLNSCLQDACEIGLIDKEERYRTSYSFIHKTFHEFCAVYYLASLAEKPSQEFSSYLDKIKDVDNINNFEYLLWFCCGLRLQAATRILPHILNILDIKLKHNTTIVRCFLDKVSNKDDYFNSEEFHRDVESHNLPEDERWKLPLRLFNEASSQFTSHDDRKLLGACIRDSCQDVRYIDVSKYVFKPYSINLDNLLGFLHNITSLKLITLQGIDLIQKHQLKVNTSTQRTVMDLGIIGSSDNYVSCEINTLLQLLTHLPKLQTLTLVEVHITGEIDQDASIQPTTLKQLNVRSLNDEPEMKKVMALLTYMPDLEDLSITKASVVTEWNPSSLKSCQRMKSFELSTSTYDYHASSINEDHFSGILDYAPSLSGSWSFVIYV